MEETVVSNTAELYELFPYLEDENPSLGGRIIKNVIFNYPIELHIDLKIFSGAEHPSFINCTFNHLIVLVASHKRHYFNGCTFNSDITIDRLPMKGRCDLHCCHFKENVDFYNRTFENTVDFWKSTFYKPTIFFKTNFLKNVVFAEVKFLENALFTYTTFEGSVIFRQAVFKHVDRDNSGLDLSLALFNDFSKLNMFDIELNDYEAYIGENYNDGVAASGKIPLVNKRETFRLIKKHFEDIGDIPSSLKFKKLEKAAYKQEITSKYGMFRDWSWKKNGTSFLDYLKTKSNRFILWANSQSNDFGLSYLRAGGWILFVSLIIVYAQMLLTGNYIPSLSHLSWSEGFNYYFQFIDPFHKSNYMGDGQNSLFYILDFIGRAVIAYLIFQFVQAFRKYR
jgi:hypothetical protein